MSFRRRAARELVAALTAVLLASCANLEFTRDTQTSGHFKSSGFAVTLISYDIPAAAITIARDNASDARLTNIQVEEAKVWPNLGWFDWLFDIVGMRWATVSGTWGFRGDEPAAAAAAAPAPAPAPAPVK
jgi:hypothetical protein